MQTNTPSNRAVASVKPTTWMERPQFHLLYLPFYCIPWFFSAPTWMDIGAAVIALVAFCPLYFRSFGQGAAEYLLHALAIEGIALAIAPFNGMEGTFHIYAVSIAGFQSDIRRGIVSVLGLCIIYGLFAQFVIQASFSRTALVLFMSGVVGATCIASLQAMIAQNARERSLVLDRQLAAVEERERIARDLHDILGHTLTMVAVKADLAQKLVETDPRKARTEIADIRQTARRALRDVRDMVQGMTVVTVAEEIDRARESLKAMDIDLRVSGAVPNLPHQLNKTVGLAIREAVTNIVRHSGATRAELNLNQTKELFRFSIVDNGRGADRNESLELGAGLQGLTRRVAALGGTAQIDASAGTRLDVSLPFTVEGAI